MVHLETELSGLPILVAEAGEQEGNKAHSITRSPYTASMPTGKITKLMDEIYKPNGELQDYKKLYVSDTGDGKNIKVWISMTTNQKGS